MFCSISQQMCHCPISSVTGIDSFRFNDLLFPKVRMQCASSRAMLCIIILEKKCVFADATVRACDQCDRCHSLSFQIKHRLCVSVCARRLEVRVESGKGWGGELCIFFPMFGIALCCNLHASAISFAYAMRLLAPHVATLFVEGRTTSSIRTTEQRPLSPCWRECLLCVCVCVFCV